MIPSRNPELGGPPCHMRSVPCPDMCEAGLVEAECDHECHAEYRAPWCGACERAHQCPRCGGAGEIGVS